MPRLLSMSDTGGLIVVESGGKAVARSIFASPHEVVDVERYSAEHDLRRVGVDFATDEELNAYVSDNVTSVGRVFPEIEDYDADEVRDAIAETTTADTPAARESARALLEELLSRSPAVAGDAELRRTAEERLGGLVSGGRNPQP